MIINYTYNFVCNLVFDVNHICWRGSLVSCTDITFFLLRISLSSSTDFGSIVCLIYIFLSVCAIYNTCIIDWIQWRQYLKCVKHILYQNISHIIFKKNEMCLFFFFILQLFSFFSNLLSSYFNLLCYYCCLFVFSLSLSHTLFFSLFAFALLCMFICIIIIQKTNPNIIIVYEQNKIRFFLYIKKIHKKMEEEQDIAMDF